MKKKIELNEFEEAFCYVINEAKMWVGNNKELEINFEWHDENEHKMSGWYAYEYDEVHGYSNPIYKNEYDKKPLISEITEKDKNIDVYKCLDYCKVAYVAK